MYTMYYLTSEAGTVLCITTIFIGSFVNRWTDKLIYQVGITSMKLYTVIAGLFSSNSSIYELIANLYYLIM